MERIKPIKVALGALGVVLLERLADDLVHLMQDGLLNDLIAAVSKAITG